MKTGRVSFPHLLLGTTLLLCLVNAIGCTGHRQLWTNSRHDFYQNDLAAAHQGLTEIGEKPSSQAVAELDLAMVELFQGQPKAAEKRLREVRAQWQSLQKKSLAEETQAYLTDDQAKKYSGEIYEQMTLGVMLTLCSLMTDGVDAESYTLQTFQQQQDLLAKLNTDREEPLEAAFGIPPSVPYFRGILREATLHDHDDALRMYQLTHALLPDHPQLTEDIQRTQTANHSRPGHGVVYVLAFVGRGPYKIEDTEPVTQAVMLQTEQILSIFGEYSVPPTLAPIKFPVVTCAPAPFDVVGVQVNGQPAATTNTMTDFEELARETYEANKTRMMARTVARRIVKKGAIYAAKSSLNANDMASWALDAVGVVWEATESADLRCWGLLPRELQVVRLELPVGNHELKLEPVTNGYPVGLPTTCRVEVGNARNTYVLGFWPERDRVGELLVSGQATR